jgi:hypothetical protein
MEYTTRIVKSASGLSQTDALISLQDHPEFVAGTRIASIYNQGGYWVAKLLEPKIAEFEKIEEDIDESPADLHEDLHELEESPLEEIEEHEDHEDSEEKKIAELEKKIDLLLDALGISEKGDEPEMPKAPKADAPAAPAPKGGPKSEPLPPGSGAKLKPGEVPNKPGMTPVGSPAFSSVKTANCEGSCEVGSCENCDKQRKEAQASMPPNAQGIPSVSNPAASGPVAGAPIQEENCMQCGHTPCVCSKPAASMSPNTVSSFTASRLDQNRELTIRQAKAALENEFKGFRVARIKRDGDYIHALVSR